MPKIRLSQLPRRVNLVGVKLPTARGRRPRPQRGVMNQTERRYAEHLAARQAAGEVLWHGFEVVTFTLAKRLRYTPDFLVMLSDCAIELHEIKGRRGGRQNQFRAQGLWEDDARAKIKMAAELFPLFRFAAYVPAQRGGWVREEFGAADA